MKRNVTRFLMVLAMICASTIGYAQKNVLNETFTTALPAGWSQTGSVWMVADGAAVYKTDQNLPDTIVAKMVNVSTLAANRQVTVFYKLLPYAQTTVVDDFTILYRTAADAEWTVLEKLAKPATDWTEANLSINSVAGDFQLAFAANPQYAGGIQIKQVKVESESVCGDLIPTIDAVQNITASSAALSWTISDEVSQDDFTGYQIKISKSPLANPSVESAEIDITQKKASYSPEGLNTGTQYFVYIRTICTDNDGSPWASTSFTTLCEIAAGELFSYDFEESELSDCFVVVKSRSSETAELSGNYANTGSQSFLMSNYAGYYSWIYLPQIKGDLASYQISFYIATDDASTSFSRKISIGASANADGVDFQVGQTFELPQARRWEKVTYLLKGLAGKGQYIALRSGDESIKNKIYIDNISLEPSSTCLTPMFVKVNEVSDKSAVLSWVEAGTATAWNVIVSPVEWTADQLADEDFVAESEYLHEANSNPFTVTGLQPSKKYFVYVASSCASQLLWSQVQSFKTAKEITFPYSEMFDRFDATLYTNTSAAVPVGWITGARKVGTDEESSNNTGQTDAYAAMSTSEDAGGSNYVAASLIMKGTSEKSAYAIMPAMPASAPDLKECMLEFYVHSSMSDGKIVVGVCDELTWNKPAGKMFKDADANFKAIDTITLTDEVKTGWQHVAVNLKDYAGSGKYLALRTLPVTSTFTPYIDNITLRPAPTCFDVRNVKANVESAVAAKLSWEELGKSTSWQVKVSSTAMEDMSATADIYENTVSAQEVALTGLTKKTTYYAYVRSNCEESGWQTITFSTPDALTLPVYYDFTAGVNAAGASGTGNAYHPENWVTGNFQLPTNASYGAYIATTTWTDATADIVKNSLELNGYLTLKHAAATGNTIGTDARTAYAVLPQFTGSKVKDMVMSFYAYVNSANTSTSTYHLDKLWIGVSSTQNPTSVSDIKKVYQVVLDAAKKPQAFELKMSDYVTTDEDYLVFIAEVPEPVEADWPTTNTTWYKYAQYFIDNLFIGLPTSPRPISELAATPTSDGAALSWKENGTATKWNIKVYDSPILNPTVDGAVAVKELTVTSNNYTLTGLDMSKMYYVYVQSVVGSQTGEWANTSFKTICGDITLPWLESFNYVAATTMYSTADKLLTPCISYANGGTPSLATATGTSFGSSVCPDHIMGQDPTAIPTESKYDSKTNPLHYVLKLQSSSSASSKIIQIDLPEMPAKLNTLQLTFYLAPYSSYHCGVRVGIQTATEFIPVQNILGEAGRWTECIVSFASLADDVTGKIAIRSDYDFFKNEPGYGFTSSYTGGFVDDILVEKIPQCAKISSISVSEIDSVSATISWVKASAEALWNVKVSSTEMSDMSATADIYNGSVAQTSLKVSALSALTEYFVYVQASRPDEDCVGDWSNAAKFKTTAKAIDLPYFMDFESEPANSITNTEGQIVYLPTGMTSTGDEGGKIFMAMNTGGATLMTAYSGKYVLDMQTSVGKANYLVLPLTKTDDVKKLQLEFYAQTGRMTSYDYTYFDVGVIKDPSNPATYSSIIPNGKDSVMRRYITIKPTDDGWAKYIYTFENYTPEIAGQDGKYIAIRPMEAHNQTSGALANGKIFVDNILIKLRDAEEIIEPFALWVSDRSRIDGKDDVTLEWHANSLAETNFRIKMFEGEPSSADDAASLNAIVTGVNSAVISGAKPNTVYYAYIRAEKDGKNSRWSDPLIFRTTVASLDPLSLPYTEDFEYPYYAPKNSATTTTVATCAWNIVKTSGNLSTSASYKKDNSKNCLLLGANAQLMTPALSVENWKDVTISMDVMASTTATAVFQVRLAETADNAGVTGSELIGTYELVKSSGWTKIMIPLSTLTSARDFKYVYITCDKQVPVDNISITEGNASFKPENLAINDFGDTWAAYSFDEYTDGISQWTVQYGPSGFALGEGTQKVINAKADTLTGLTPATTYDIYVTSSAVNKWAGPITVTLATKGATLPYYTNFSDDEDNALWHNLNDKDADKHNVHFIIGNASECGGTGEKALFLSDDDEHYHYHTTQTAYFWNWTAHTINVPSAGTYMFYLRMKAEGVKNYTEDCVTITLSPASATYTGYNITSIDKVSLSNTADKPENNHYAIVPRKSFLDHSDWVDVYVKKDILQPGSYQLLVNWTTYSVNNGPKLAPIAIDTISIEEFECTEAQNVKLDDITDHSASFSWFGGKTKTFEVAVTTYRDLANPFGIDAEDYLAHETITDGPAYTISGLQANTDYYLYVRSICGDGPTDSYAIYPFRTACGAYDVPFTEEFYQTPDCWTLSSGVSAKSHKVETDEMKLAGTEDIYYYLNIPKNGYAVLPLLSEPINNLDIKVDAWNIASTASYPISIGVVTIPTDISTYENLYTYDMRNTNSTTGTYLHIDSEAFEFYTNKYTGSGKYLVIRGNANAAVGVRSIRVTALPSCVPPTQVEVTQLKETSAVVSWQTGSETAWKIYLNDGNQEKVIDVTENPFTLTGLESGTDYTVQVQAVCGGEDVSTKSIEKSFRTLCSAFALPFNEDFSGLKTLSYAQLNCWDNYSMKEPIESVFDGKSLSELDAFNELCPSESFWNYNTWTDGAYWIKTAAAGNAQQLVSWDYTPTSKGPAYKWFVSPRINIDSETLLSFSMAYVQNISGTIIEPTGIGGGRFIIAVSADAGATWKSEDATEIDLSKYGVAYQNVTVDLNKYIGKTIRIAFYHEIVKSTSKSYFLLVDNMEVSSGKQYVFNESICAGKDYNDHGFTINASDLVIGQVNTFEREQAGDVITLNLTVEPMAQVEETVDLCDGDVYENNGIKYTTDFDFVENYYNEDGCLVRRTNHLRVKESTTEEITGTVDSEKLPYQFDEYLLIPEGASGLYEQTILTGPACVWNHYLITIRQTQTSSVADNVCENADAYTANGFNIDKADFAAVGESINRTREENMGEYTAIYNLTLTTIPVATGDTVAYTCPGTPFEWHGQICDDISKTYTHKFEAANGCDSIVTLALKEYETYNLEQNVFLCYGTQFIVPETGEIISEAGPFKREFKSVNGCDSIMTYIITIGSKTTAEESITLCEGAPLVWNDVNIASVSPADSKDYEFTTKSLINTECDSTITLHLTVNPVIKVSDVRTACVGEDYFVGDLTVKAEETAGEYQHSFTLTAANGCDSIVNITLTVLPKYNEQISDEICAGQHYTFNNIEKTYNVAGVQTEVANLQSKNGCDSIVTLTLNVIEKSSYSITKTIYVDELPYTDIEFGLFEIPEGSAPDVYTYSGSPAGEPCTTVTYNITVKDIDTSIDGVSGGQLTVYPNLLSASQKMTVAYSFTDEQMNGLKVSVYDLTGSLVDTFAPTTDHFTVEAPAVSGMYTLRITTGTNEQFTAKFAVR